MSIDTTGASPEAHHSGPKGARLKRVIILPFFLITGVGFALSWILYIDSSREALRDAVSAIMRESSDRIAEEMRGRLNVAAHAARANAAFISSIPHSDDEASYIRRAFLDQLRGDPMIAILAVGTEDGEYLEAQRQADNSYRVGAAGTATGGALAFKPVLADGSFGEPNLQAAGYDPRKRPWYRAAIAANGPAWSAPYTLYSNAEPVVAATMPMYANGKLAGVCSATITLGTLSRYLADMKEAQNGFMYVSDAEGRLIAISTAALTDLEGNRALAASHADIRVASAASAAGSALARDSATDPGRFSFRISGRRYLGRAVPFTPGSNLDWTIVLAVTEDSYAQKLLAADFRNFILLAVFLGVSFMVGWFVVGYITKPIRTMADCVDMLLPGKPIPQELNSFSTRDNELGRLSRSFVAMKIRLDESFGALEASLSEKDVLLKEVHHRVKNNLQIVSSILSIQSGTLDDASARIAFEECQDRIQAMALVHEEVYRTGSFVELGMYGYLNQICETLGWGRNRGTCITNIDVLADELVALSLDKAIPCGLVVNELVTNALKHAFTGRALGSITVSFAREDASWRLTVTDDGIGRGTSARSHDAVAVSTGKGIGEQLVVGLVAQLSGTHNYETPPGGGTAAIIEFPA